MATTATIPFSFMIGNDMSPTMYSRLFNETFDKTVNELFLKYRVSQNCSFEVKTLNIAVSPDSTTFYAGIINILE